MTFLRAFFGIVVCAALSAAVSTAAARDPDVPVPESPAAPVAAPRPSAPAEGPERELTPEIRERIRSLTLADVIDIGLRNNTITRETWARARAAAADLGEQRADLYPEIDGGASVSRVKQSAVGGQFVFQQTTWGPEVSLSYLLFDSGGRKARIEEMRQALIAADWAHNTAIQNVVLLIQEAYYDYLNAKARLEAGDAAVHEAEVNLASAQTRHDAGVATIADVLQAKTALSQARLVRLTVEGDIRALLGQLATALGLPANTDLDVGVLPAEPPIDETMEEIEPLIESALAERPDLAQAYAQVHQADSKVASARADRLPTVELSGGVNRTYYGTGGNADNWAVSVDLTVPLFDGSRRRYAVHKARAEAAAERASAESLRQAVILDVWTSYQDVKTAAQRVETSRDLLESAEQSERVALGRYQEGVGGIVDLLTAQAQLASARAQEIQARSDWFVAMARLAHATGTLGPAPEPAGTPPARPAE